MPHVIRLREPWQHEQSPRGTILCRRRFGRPTGIEPDDLVAFVIARQEGLVRVVLNDQPLEPLSATDAPSLVGFDVSVLLNNRNEVVVEVAGTPLSEARLEIYPGEK